MKCSICAMLYVQEIQLLLANDFLKNKCGWLTLLKRHKALPQQKYHDSATSPRGQKLQSLPARPTNLSCASSMYIQNRPARAQFIHDTSPFEFLTLKTATITASCHKAKCVEDADAAITVATMEQVRSLLWHQMSAMALSAGAVG